ncbi:MAG: glycosyltransferase family 39 protein [Thermoleophilaceae bacterium]
MARRLILGVVFLALLLRLGAVAATTEFAPGTDAADFDRQAISIAAGHGYPPTAVAGAGGPSAFRPPGLPYLLAGTYAVVGVDSERRRWTAGRVVEAVLGAATVGLIGLLALALWGAAPAVAASALAAVYPPFLLIESSLTSETLFLPLVVGSVLAMLHYRSSRRLRWAILAGAVAGLAGLTRSNGLILLIPLAAGALTAFPWRSRAAVAGVLATILAGLLAISPWTIRNAVVMDAFVPVTTQAGYGLAGAYNDSARNDENQPAAWRPPTVDPAYRAIIEDPALNEVQVERRLRSESWKFIASHPEHVARAGLMNALRLAILRDREIERLGAADLGMNPTLSNASVYSFWAVALLAIAGLFNATVRRTPAFVWATPVLLLLTTVFIAAWTRYRIPADPFLVALAGLGAFQVAEVLRRLRRRAPWSR